MATGKQIKLTGQIGEHLVAAKLGTMGILATPFSGNVPGFDISAVDLETGRSFVVQVKTSNDGGALLHSDIKKWAEYIFNEDETQTVGESLPLDSPDRIWVMVNISNNDLTSVRYFVCTEAEIQKCIIDHYKAYLKKHDGRRPKNPKSRHVGLTLKDLTKYEDNWEIING